MDCAACRRDGEAALWSVCGVKVAFGYIAPLRDDIDVDAWCCMRFARLRPSADEAEGSMKITTWIMATITEDLLVQTFCGVRFTKLCRPARDAMSLFVATPVRMLACAFGNILVSTH